MKLAYEEAKKAFEIGEVPVGAVIVKGNKVVGRGYNVKESSKDPTAHAEMMAIRQASRTLGGWRLIGCTMYVTLEPCPMCAGAIVNSRIDRIVIGTRDSRMGACGSNLNLLQNSFSNHRVEIKWDIMKTECSGILSEFFKILRETKNMRNYF
ncbi:tRNA-specific adenosine deaminase [Andreesenia angusta]|uniref:tRNA-specific adenosine deaminase n=2 Tax=Andreesenia angusta TaxID=39480 RepID=A0A1S1V4Y6_9FIRM|nr:tRNA-specific adenosine deaminase [Andreesenia angusta]